ncbi:MAG: RNA-binding protein [Spirochaetaceae bacterium]|mgnify:CR=1 FL=1|nr:RNA-binding protein [Spirochaetaceae bacterium]|tara:strand:+ start:30363 stop:30617 length:255 start_codon:yes stop_codon:yes gene_type:complete
MKLYVGNISFDTTQQSLSDLFAAFGDVDSANIITDRETGRSRGFGFVEMPNKKEAIAAMSNLSESEVDGRQLVVNEARPRNDRF